MAGEYRLADAGIVRMADGAVLLPGIDGWAGYEDWLRAGGKPLPPPAKSRWKGIDIARAEMLAAVRLERARREAAGFSFRGKVIESDAAARVRLFSAILAALVAKVGLQAFSRDWITADGSTLALDLPGMLALAQALAAYDNACAANAAALKEQIGTLDMPALEVFDFSTGWPT